MNNDSKSKNNDKLSTDELINKYNKEKKYRNEVNQALASSGIVLEQELEGVFQNLKYKETEATYVDVDEIGIEKTRQIDIYADKEIKIINFLKNNSQYKYLVNFTRTIYIFLLDICQKYQQKNVDN
jgi:hypothetical protein